MREAHSVEAHQPAMRGQPQIAIARLQDVIDGVLWQAVLGCPGVEQTLSRRVHGQATQQDDAGGHRDTPTRAPADMVE